MRELFITSPKYQYTLEQKRNILARFKMLAPLSNLKLFTGGEVFRQEYMHELLSVSVYLGALSAAEFEY